MAEYTNFSYEKQNGWEGCAPERCQWQIQRGGKQVPRSANAKAFNCRRQVQDTANGFSSLIKSKEPEGRYLPPGYKYGGFYILNYRSR